ncbi:hypothetical protein ACFYWF_06785 [Streptomyces sp. NPDC003344]|uniref:hypothetical protein n=1 Tax=Streptomyces sp. NPDC003344 TaxID=3364682 RepID=UPI00369E54E1
MFAIRIVCDPAEAESITTALRRLFITGTARQYPARDGHNVRLYLTAEEREPDTTAPAAEVDGMTQWPWYLPADR